jgi:hypothetical protein
LGEFILLKILKPLLGSLEHEFLFFKKSLGDLHALLKPRPGNSQKNQRTTQHWKKPNKKKPSRNAYTLVKITDLSAYMDCYDIIQLMLL